MWGSKREVRRGVKQGRGRNRKNEITWGSRKKTKGLGKYCFFRQKKSRRSGSKIKEISITCYGKSWINKQIKVSHVSFLDE